MRESERRGREREKGREGRGAEREEVAERSQEEARRGEGGARGLQAATISIGSMLFSGPSRVRLDHEKSIYSRIC